MYILSLAKVVFLFFQKTHVDLITGDLTDIIKGLHTTLNEKLENILMETKRCEGL